ncbi:MAG: delta-60 repeat domain-containing protein, partial [Sediminibacterium sp.]
FSCTYELTNAPNLVSMSSFMPTNIRKIDFMRSIINRFRLVFVPSRDNEKQFEIIPWKDWVLLGDQRDWTSKLDGTKDLKITPLFYSQDRLQVFKDQEDADFVNYNYQLDYKQTYGQKNLDSNNELIKGTKEYKDQFAPLPLWPIGNVEPEITPGTPNPLYGFVIPHLAKDTDKERQPIQPKLRLAYYNGLQSVPTVPAGYQQGFYMMVGATPTLFSSYPLMSQYSTWPVTSTTFDLAWENEQALYNLEQSGLNGNLTSYDCYNVFWKTWYDTTFDPFSRIVEANFVLGYDDIIDLKFNDYIFVKDSWYFVNKITDYVIGTETNCRVELIKVGNNIGLVIPPTVELKTMVELCFSNATACDAYCCNTGNVQVGQYFMNTLDFSTATELYLDVLGQVPAPSGYYSDGTITYFVDGGVMIFAANTAGCFCTPPTLVQYTACPGADSCEACCCTNEEVTVYGTGSTLAGSLNVYFDSGGTLPATGWYKATGEIYSVYVVNGVTQQVSNCDLCNCSPITIYEYEVTFSDESPCDACCIGTPITIWTDADTFVNSTVVYIDNVPLTLSGAAWYQLNGDILVVDASGNVTAIGTCSVCTCLNYYRAENCNTPGLYADFSYATSLSVGEVVSSLDYPGECWTIVDTATAGTPIHEVFTSCAECLPPVTCNCVNYNVKSLLGGAIGYVDCADQEVYYIDIPAGFDQDLCACEDSLVVLAGKVKWQADGLCDVAGSELVVSGIFRSIDGHQTNQAALLDANGNVQTTFSTFDTIGQNGFSPDTAPIYGVLKQDDSIWFAGQFTSYQNQIALGLLKVDYTGAVDPSYDPQFNGFPVGQYPYDIQKFSDGSLVLSGLFTDYDSEGTGSATANRIVCIQQDGSLDPTFVSGTGFNQTINKAIIKNDIWYGAAWTTNLVTYKNSSGSRFVAINRNGDRITNYGIASTNIPTNFNFDVDDLGRVYIAYEYEDAIYVERWLPSGAKDPSYTFSWVSPTPLYAFPYIYINNNYECFVSIQETNGLNVNILKVNASGQLDATFGVRQVTSSAAGYSQVIGIDQVGVFISNYLTLGGEEIAYTYDGILTGAITKVDQTTGYIIGSFNQIDFTPTADINRYIDRISV